MVILAIIIKRLIMVAFCEMRLDFKDEFKQSIELLEKV